ADGNLLIDLLAYTRELIPSQFTLHALGVGHPASIVACARLGYNIFDSTMPTRDARHGRLITFTTDPNSSHLDENGRFFRYIYIKDKKHVKTNLPLSQFCDCLTCTRYTLGYLHHLYKINDVLYQRLATLHNLHFMVQLMENLRSERT
ncbi:MAG: tRNA-guanine transglycosylase, partial [Chloroflexi bacterium]|nr:tRNA-guanine transglycosylase [Chloroflexota bacterium]